MINVPIGALALIAAPRSLPESRAPHSSRIDLVGTTLVTAGLTAIVLPLVEGRQHGWPVWTVVSLALAPVILGAFAIQQRRLADRGGSPLLELSLFSQRTFSAGLLAQLVFWCGQASFFLVLALYLQHGRGLSALHAGLVFTILAASYLAASMRRTGAGAAARSPGAGSGRARARVRSWPAAGAVADVGIGGSVLALVPGLLLVGAGMGLGITPLATIIMSGMKPEHAGAASGVLSTMQNVGNALGVAIIGVIFFGALNSTPAFADAFQLSLAALAAILIGVAALTRLLPAPVRS